MVDQPAGEVRVQQDGGGGVLISVVGEFDVALLDSFVQAVQRGGGNVVVDLSETTFLDSSGLRALVIGRNDALGRGARLRIDGVSDAASLSLAITGLSDFMGVASSGDAAERADEDGGVGKKPQTA
jgi:anti-sigma B factor antagonist